MTIAQAHYAAGPSEAKELATCGTETEVASTGEVASVRNGGETDTVFPSSRVDAQEVRPECLPEPATVGTTATYSGLSASVAVETSSASSSAVPVGGHRKVVRSYIYEGWSKSHSPTPKTPNLVSRKKEDIKRKLEELLTTLRPINYSPEPKSPIFLLETINPIPVVPPITSETENRPPTEEGHVEYLTLKFPGGRTLQIRLYDLAGSSPIYSSRAQQFFDLHDFLDIPIYYLLLLVFIDPIYKQVFIGGTVLNISSPLEQILTHVDPGATHAELQIVESFPVRLNQKVASWQGSLIWTGEEGDNMLDNYVSWPNPVKSGMKAILMPGVHFPPNLQVAVVPVDILHSDSEALPRVKGGGKVSLVITQGDEEFQEFGKWYAAN